MSSAELNRDNALRFDRTESGVAHGAPRYALTIPTDARRTLAVWWLALGVLALVAAGILSVLLVVSRTPLLQNVFHLADFFRVALVAHVDLSVLVWFLAFAGVLWTLNGTPRGLSAGRLAFGLAAAGTVAIALAPFLGQGRPVMANYIPVLRDPWFLTGLVTFGVGVAILVLRGMATAPRVGIHIDGAGALRFGLNASLVSTAVALIAFAWSYRAVPTALDPVAYYELLFWGGGHVLQFTWTLLMLVAWLALADATGARVPLSPRVATLLFGIALAAAFITPAIYLAYDVGSVEHHRLLTWLMQFGGGLAIPPVALAVLWACGRRGRVERDQCPLRAALLTSITLFGVGGIIGFFIHGSNVKIPAHYHGSIVGVTIALMGLAYLLLPALGFARPSVRLATPQPYLYGGGQLLHVIGLVWSGGYGVQRKVAGSEQVLHSTQEILAMGLMGLGGLIAIVGGVLFVFVVLEAIYRGRRRPTP
ncbi:MAG TPA: cbb3-type cytochrome c oxidase subunit I [Casimicrobiaceae bacterium]